MEQIQIKQLQYKKLLLRQTGVKFLLDVIILLPLRPTVHCGAGGEVEVADSVMEQQ
jgi:hypothetical protein